ncbi:MAG: alpha/beta hydrolase [Verrucomicrobia bacterium]|nr:alpha/beta hydrolase [Verrucomicrobiota bacterium]
MNKDVEQLQLRIHGDASLPTLVYLPGTHGDWTLVTSFRLAMAKRVRFVEFTYPRTVTWSLDDYAAAVEAELLANGIQRGWLLGESFSSIVAWAMIGRNSGGENRFQIKGLILTNGFVRHPLPWGARLAKRFCAGVSLTWLTRFLYLYAKYARFRHRHAPETMASIKEFIARRTDLDRCAAAHRLGLIAENDLRDVARRTHLPVYYLAGMVDPIVPWYHARWWLRRNCPGYRGGKTVWRADHNVLGTAPKTSANQVVSWLNETREPSPITQTSTPVAARS